MIYSPAVRFLCTLLVSAALAVAALIVSPAAAQAAPETVNLAEGKGRCAKDEIPYPADPSGGLLGSFTAPDEDTNTNDPFGDDDPGNMVDVYGFHTQFFVFDTGCFPGSGMMPNMLSDMDNFGLSVILFAERAAYLFMTFAVSPESWIKPVDTAVSGASDVVEEGVYKPWIVVGILVAGSFGIVAAWRGAASRTVTIALWAVAVIGLASMLVQYPVKSLNAFDENLQGAVSVIANANAKEDQTAEEAITDQFDQIHRTAVYDQWLTAYFGSPDSKAAEEYGSRLFKATHLTLEEAKQVNEDADKRKEIIDQKQEDFTKVTDEIVEDYPAIYDNYIAGGHSRIANTTASALIVGAAILFVVVAGLWIAISLIALRIAVVVAPAAAPIAVIEKVRSFVTKYGQRIGTIMIAGPLFFIAALVNLAFNSAIMKADLMLFIKVLLLLGVTVLMFFLFRPMSAYVTGGRRGGAGFMKALGLGAVMRRRQSYRREDGTRMSRAERKQAKRGHRDARRQARIANAAHADDRRAGRHANRATRKLRRRHTMANLGDQAQVNHGKRFMPKGMQPALKQGLEAKKARRRAKLNHARDEAKQNYLRKKGYPVPNSGSDRDKKQRIKTNMRREGLKDPLNTSAGKAGAYAVDPVGSAAADTAMKGGKKVADGVKESRAKKSATAANRGQAQRAQQTQSKWAAPASRRPFTKPQPALNAGVKRPRSSGVTQQRFAVDAKRQRRVANTAMRKGL